MSIGNEQIKICPPLHVGEVAILKLCLFNLVVSLPNEELSTVYQVFREANVC